MLKFLSFGLILLQSLHVFASIEGCSKALIPMDKRLQIAQTQLEGVKTVLGEANEYRQPIETLFLVDLQNEELVTKRRAEISALITKEAVLESLPFKELLRCGPGEDFKELAGLISSVNVARLKFYEKARDVRLGMIDEYTTERASKQNAKQLDQEIEKYQSKIKDSQTDYNEEETNSNEDSSPELQRIIAAKKDLEKYRSDEAAEQLKFLQKVKAKEKVLDNLHNDLRAASLKSETQSLSLMKQLDRAIDIWTSSVDQVSTLFSELSFVAASPIPDKLKAPLSQTGPILEKWKEYSQEYNEVQLESLQLHQSRTERLNALKAKGYLLLSDAGQRRASLLAQCDQEESCPGHRGLSSRNLSSMYREVSVFPVKIGSWAIAKFLEIKGKVTSGFDGWLDLAQQSVVLLLLFFLPVLFYRTLLWLTGKLDSFRKSLLAKSMIDFRRRTSYATWISRLTPFMPASGMALGFWILRIFIEETDFAELSEVLFYVQLYYIYRVFRLCTKIVLSSIFSSDSVTEMRERRMLAERTSKRVSGIIFLEYAFLHLIEAFVRKALVYGLFVSIVFELNLLFLFWETHCWRASLQEAVLLRFPKLQNLIRVSENNRLMAFLMGPIYLLIVGLNDLVQFIYQQLIHFDIFKRLNSDFLRRRLEESANVVERQLPGNDYLKSFDYYLPASGEILVEFAGGVTGLAEGMIADWKLGKSVDDLLVIVGNRGMGKTTVLNAIAKNLSPIEVVRRASPKILNSEELFSWLGQWTEREIHSVEDFLKYDDELSEKKTFFIDDIQNLFLGTLEGFGAYRTLIELIGLRTKNIFWCLTVNSRSWAYLNGIFGYEHFHGKVLQLSPWSESEIQKLIIARHNFSGYERKFDPSIKAYGAGADALGQQTETQFFRLLWGQSRGNPRSALMYWVSAVTQEGVKSVLVGVPSFVSTASVSTLSDESHFILASITRHDSLTIEEIVKTTVISVSVVRRCIKEVQDRQLIWMDDTQRLRISSRAQYVIDYFLIGKNFLYE